MSSYYLKKGTILDGRYLIGDVIGEGGFGITYRAETQRLGMQVAIKEYFCRDYMHRDVSVSDEIGLLDPAAAGRFEKEKERVLKEARILRDFSNEKGVVRVVDYFESNNTAYIVMDYIDGETLREHVRKNGRMAPEAILPPMKQLLTTLGKIHESGLIHRDISPDNIMLLSDGSLCLIDFGAAYRYDDRTQSYTIIGKNCYSAPEQYASDGNVGPGADIYSLAATLFYCLTAADPEDSLQRMYMQSRAKAPSAMGVTLPEGVDRLVLKGLALKAEERYADAAAFRDAIDKLYPDAPEGAGKGRKWIFAGILAGLIAAAAGGLIWYRLHRVELKFRNIETESVWLVPDGDMNLRDYLDAAKTVKGRLQAFAGEDNYLWEEKDGEIKMEFPESLLCGKDPEYAVRAYLSRPLRMYATDPDLGNSGSMTAKSILERCVELPRESIREISIFEGDVPGANRAELGLPEEGPYRCLRIELEEGAAKEINEAYSDILKSEGKRLDIYYDLDLDIETYYGENALACGDGRSFFLINTDQEGSFIETLRYDLTHEVSPCAMGVNAEVKISWEDVATTVISGKNQCDFPELGDAPAILQYDMSAGVLTGDTAHIWSVMSDLTLFKYRLDGLEIPYALGVGKHNPFSSVMRKGGIYDLSTMESSDFRVFIGVREEDLTFYMAETLGQDPFFELQSKRGLDSEASPVSLELAELGADERGLVLRMEEESDLQELAKSCRVWQKEGEEWAYLSDGSDVYAKAKVEDILRAADTGELIFTELCLTEAGKPGVSFEAVASYLAHLAKDNMQMRYGYQRMFRPSEENRPVFLSESAYPGRMNAETIEAAREIEKELGDSWTKVSVSGAFTLGFFHEVPGGEDYMARCLEQVEKVCKDCRLDERTAESIFYFDQTEQGRYRTIVWMEFAGDGPKIAIDIYTNEPDYENNEWLMKLKESAGAYVAQSDFFKLTPDEIDVGYLGLL